MSKVENISTQLAAAANVKDKWGGIVINAKAAPYNAAGNGTTDDTIALQLAINYANSIGKKEIILPAGTYLYTVLTGTANIVFVGDGVTLTGTTPLTLTSLASQLAETVTKILNVITGYGAIADGTSHPLSERYPTLTLAKMRYPSATSLTDEIDWAACQTAANDSANRSISNLYGNTAKVAVGPTVVMPLGAYVFNRPVTLSVSNGTVLFQGESAVIIPSSSSVTAFDIAVAWGIFKGIKFVNANIGISFTNANTDGGFLKVEDCEFHECYTQGILFNAQSSDLIIDRCRFIAFNRSTSNAIKSTIGTTITLNSCWIETNCAYVFDILAERINMNDCTGAPTGASTWVKLRAGSFVAKSCRFGGEASTVLVENYSGTSPNGYNAISVIDCMVNIVGYIMKLYNIPQGIYMRNNKLYTTTYTGFWVDPAMLSSDLLRMNSIKINTDFAFTLYGVGLANNVNQVVKMNNTQRIGTSFIKVSDLMINQNIQVAGYTPIVHSDGCTIDTGQVDPYGTPVVKITSNAVLGTTPVYDYEKKFNYVAYGWGTPTEKYYYENVYGNGMYDLPNGLYTCIFNIEILVDGYYQIAFMVGKQVFTYTLTFGKHTICIPCRVSTADALHLLGVIAGNLFPGASLQIGRYRVVKGHVDINTINTTFEDTAAPSAGILFGSFFKGDIVKNSNPTELGTAGSKYIIDRWVCTVSGTVGTWLPCRVLTGN